MPPKYQLDEMPYQKNYMFIYDIGVLLVIKIEHTDTKIKKIKTIA